MQNLLQREFSVSRTLMELYEAKTLQMYSLLHFICLCDRNDAKQRVFLGRLLAALKEPVLF